MIIIKKFLQKENKISDATVEKNAESESMMNGEAILHNDLIKSGNMLPCETSQTGISATTVSIGDMSEYDKAIETKPKFQTRKLPIMNKEVREIVDTYGHRLYAYVTEDEKGDRSIEFCQKYCTGAYSAILKMAQADVVMASMPQSLMDDRMQKSVDRFIVKAGKEYLNKFSGRTCDALNIKDIIHMLSAELSEIPVYDDDLTEEEKRIFHQKVIEIVGMFVSQTLNDHEAYYTLDRDDLGYLAQSLGMDIYSLLRKLKRYDLLYLTQSSRGYQTNIRLNGMGKDSFTAWRYCIFRYVELLDSDDYLDTYDF